MNSGRHGVRVLGFTSPGLWLLALAGLGLTTFIPGAVASSPSNSLSAALVDAAVLAVAAALVLLTISARVLGTAHGICVKNLFQVISVDAQEVASVEATQGLVIVTTDGRRIRSFAYGESLAGNLLGYRRARHAQKRCQDWLTTVSLGEAQARGTVVVAIRRAVWLLPALLVGTYVAEVLLVRSFA